MVDNGFVWKMKDGEEKDENITKTKTHDHVIINGETLDVRMKN